MRNSKVRLYNELAEIKPFKTLPKKEVGEIAYDLAEYIRKTGY